MEENEKKALNQGYIKGCRDTIKMFTDLGVNLSADVLSIERSIFGEAEKAEKTESEPEKEAQTDVEKA